MKPLTQLVTEALAFDVVEDYDAIDNYGGKYLSEERLAPILSALVALVEAVEQWKLATDKYHNHEFSADEIDYAEECDRTWHRLDAALAQLRSVCGEGE